MRIIAPMMILIMMTSTLAGCTGGDPDGGGNDEIDMDILNQLIDDNLQDFINNTTITVENHYHNNTTIINNNYDNHNHFNNTTNVDGGEIHNYDNSTSIFNGSSGINSGEYYLLDIEFNIEDIIPGWNDIDYRNNTFNYSWEYYDYSTNEERTDMFEFSCQVFYIVGANSANGSAQVSWWDDSSQYYNAWSNTYNSTVRDLLLNAGSYYSRDSINNMLIEEICNEDHYTTYSGLLYEIPIVEGMALRSIDRNYDWDEYQIEYVWVQQCYSYGFAGDYRWNQNYQPLCESGNTGSVNAFYASYVFETINIHYQSMGWVGGSSDSTLEVHVNDIRPGFDYRLIVYFEMTTNMNNL